ncbi:MAG: hypothetical protein MJZ82_05530 [Paludibacteraceae bacterium]|nr:hypothetical protein [Paludibacteraceae bacterium]
MKNYKMIPKIALWVLMGLGIIATLMFFLGGNEETGLMVVDEELAIPSFTNMFLAWNYILVALVCIVTLGVVVWDFVNTYKVSPKRAIRSLIVVVGFIALIIVCWLLGSPDKIDILGYEGHDNEGAMARLSDACMYLTYILMIATVVALVWGVIYTKNKK